MPPLAISGHVERIERADGFILVLGWLRMDPALLLAGPPLLLLRTADGNAERWPLRSLRPRSDLPTWDGQPAALGFQALRASALAGETAAASVILGDHQTLLDPGEIPVRAFQARGELEAPNRHAVQGWVLDLPGRSPTLMVDGRIAVRIPIDRPRPELSFDTDEAEPRLGFRLPLTRLGDMLRAAEPGFVLLDGEPHGITLLADGVELGHQVLRGQRRLGGKLERIADGQAIGWATEAEPIEAAPAVEVLLDGTRWHTVPAATPRADLTANGVGTRLVGGAFRVELPTRSLTGAATATVELRPAHAREKLPGTTTLEGLEPWRPDRGSLPDMLPAEDARQVSIVVPIHNAAEDVARCVESVLRHTTGRARLLLIDDASTDPAIAVLFHAWEGLAGIELHRNAANLGFTATCNRGFALAGRDDVVLLNSDTQVGPGWLDGLRLAAHASPRIGTVTAVSNNAGVFSAPELDVDNRLPAWFSVADMARLARQAALALWPSAPTGNGFCLYVRRACLDAVGGFDEAAFPRGYGEENDLCMRAAAAGFEHRVDDRTWVWHRRSASFGHSKAAHVRASQAVLAERYPEYRTLVGLFSEDAAFLALRWRLRRALEATLAQGTRPRPRVLFVISTESGGTPQTNRDLMGALSDRYEPWVLRCDGRVIALTRHGAAAPEETCRLERPISPATHDSAEYDRRVADLLLRHGFELLHIRHIAWHGIGLPRVCRALGIPVVFSFHDFYALCPTIKLLDGEGRFCGGRCTQGEAECVAELWPASSMPPLRGRFVHRWRTIMAKALGSCDAFVTTSAGARDTLLDGLPFLAERDFRVIPHGRSFARLLSLAAEPAADEPLRVLVPGNISAAKGAAIIAALADHDGGREIEFHVLGAVDGILDQPRAGVVLHGRYDRDSFAERVATIGPHLAVILSTWPETYCHTLTECWAAGVPVLGSAIGAVGERIGADGGGWLVDAASAPEAIHALLLRLKDDGAELRARREEVRRWQRRIGRHYDSSAMSVAYDLLYRDLLQRRRSFAAALPEPVPRVVLALGAEVRQDGFRLPLPVRNDVARGMVFRSISATYPFGDPAAGLGDAVLAGEAAGRPRDLAAVAGQCARAGLPLQVESEAAPGGAAVRAAQAAAGAGFLVPTPLAATALRRAGYRAEHLPPRLDPADWLPPRIAELPAIPVRRAPCRLLGFADDPGLDALRPMLDDLRLLDVADYLLVGPGGLPLGRDPVAGLRAIARGCDAALFPLALAADEPRALALRACGLVLLRNRLAGEEPGETADGQLVLPQDPDVWLRAIAELSAGAPRRQALARRSRRALAARLAPGGQAELLDQVLREAEGAAEG
jgi:GT2 family glycosyltransferase/glycosyltransferase involved in cell wall biosynthesis